LTSEPARAAHLTRGGNAFAAFLRIPPFNAVCPSSGGSREKWVCTTSEREKTLAGVDCALHHEIAVQLAEIVNSEGG
jgi:hypothetical protein